MELRSRHLEGFVVHFRNEAELDEISAEVFEKQEYRFTPPRPNPLILDCGSHIGLSVLYFKKCYPDARIIAFEPHPINFTILRKNVEANRLRDVELVQAAVAGVDGEVNLYGRFSSGEAWTWGDSIVPDMWGKWESAGRDEEVAVRAVRLSSYIREPVDLVKLDIEGAEQQVIDDIAPRLAAVRELIVEFHPTATSRHVNDGDRILAVLESEELEVSVERSETKNPVLIRARRRRIGDSDWASA